jgi:ribosomal protein S18 acetylase RimI-like enzyme
MSDTVTIRTAGIDDIPVIQTLAYRIWHSHYPGIISDEQIDYMLEAGYSSDQIKREMTEDGITWLKVMDKDEMVGFAAFGSYGEKQIKLHKIYLDLNYHGKGIGTAIMAEVEQRSIASGATSIVLNVNKYNQLAIRSYKQNGYQVAESVIQDIGNGFVMDDYVMKKELVSKR